MVSAVTIWVSIYGFLPPTDLAMQCVLICLPSDHDCDYALDVGEVTMMLRFFFNGMRHYAANNDVFIPEKLDQQIQMLLQSIQTSDPEVSSLFIK